MTGPAVEVASLTKTFHGLSKKNRAQALVGVDLVIPRGTFFGLIGPNGAGKTTFVKALLGVVRPTSGSVRLFGVSADIPQVRRQVGYLPERQHFPPGATARSFLASLCRLRQVEVSEVDRQLGRVGLSAAATRRVSGFSKGMRQRLGLAAALLGSPGLLVLDEPTDGIDPLGRMQVRAILADESRRGATILMNSHLLTETERSCDRVGILVDGRLAREGTVDSLCKSADQFRLRFSGSVKAATLAGLGFQPQADGSFLLSVRDPQILGARLAQARDQGAYVVELAAVSRALEEILAEAVSGKAS